MDQYNLNGANFRSIDRSYDCSREAFTGHCTPLGELLPEGSPIEQAGFPVEATPWILGGTQANIGGAFVAQYNTATNGFDKVDGGAVARAARRAGIR
jgi:hypothetical protein